MALGQPKEEEDMPSLYPLGPRFSAEASSAFKICWHLKASAPQVGPHMVTVDCRKVMVTAEECVLPLHTLDLSQRSLLVSSTPTGCLQCLPVLFKLLCQWENAYLYLRELGEDFFSRFLGKDFRLMAARAPGGNLLDNSFWTSGGQGIRWSRPFLCEWTPPPQLLCKAF